MHGAYIEPMNRFAALAFAAVLSASPALSQEADSEMKEGMTLLEEGARVFLRGLMNEMEPTLRELAEGMEPAMRKLLEIVDDFDAYELPERLPNGDIIIRRKPPAPPVEPDAPEGEEIEI